MKHVVWSTLALFLVISGCAGQAELIQEQRNALQELADAHTRLEAEMAVLKDSLKFIDDVDSGQYYRDRRILEQRIDKLEYDLAVCHDSSDIATTEVAVIRADDLFSPASAELSAAGENRLARLADQLARDDHRTIRIEGHSDSVP
ncbi:MAG: hypothetical protein ACOCSK_02375, partial [Rhodothermales bacterium]